MESGLIEIKYIFIVAEDFKIYFCFGSKYDVSYREKFELVDNFYSKFENNPLDYKNKLRLGHQYKGGFSIYLRHDKNYILEVEDECSIFDYKIDISKINELKWIIHKIQYFRQDLYSEFPIITHYQSDEAENIRDMIELSRKKYKINAPVNIDRLTGNYCIDNTHWLNALKIINSINVEEV